MLLQVLQADAAEMEELVALLTMDHLAVDRMESATAEAGDVIVPDDGIWVGRLLSCEDGVLRSKGWEVVAGEWGVVVEERRFLSWGLGAGEFASEVGGLFLAA